ncbi:unnamed protein product [Chondrus crispus]|uniref:Uncharacterized protein n=1 Tax=Chondrus crispus TaxID=2769 RepID=R7QM71_CHOCR|nr:unnamed protein product [Chondrus crispus]CDF39602.1 unnamed protein product [Chondrus crispus]|eukprot:XP_005709896.1 unnamed protein product [Chondrus crispus]
MSGPRASAPILLALHVLLLAVLCIANPEQFPSSPATIAFHISVNEAQLPLLERFFFRIYHPSNLYLLTFAHSLDPRAKSARITGRNVHIRSAEPYVPDGVSEAINILDAMAYFLDREDALASDKPSFDYYIHCTPNDYPTVTAERMRTLLGFARDHLDAATFFHFTHTSQLPLFDGELSRIHIDYSLSFNRSLTLEEGLEATKSYHPDHRRRTAEILRTDKHFVAHRRYVKIAADSMLSKHLLMSLGDASHVFEHFFGSLAAAASEENIKLIRTTSLRCTNFNDLDRAVKHILPGYKPRSPSTDFLLRTVEPCLFTGPFPDDGPENLAIRNRIDMELLIAPGTQGRPEGPSYHDRVYGNLKRLVS